MGSCSSGGRVAGLILRSQAASQSIPEQETELQIAPDEKGRQLAWQPLLYCMNVSVNR